MFKKYSIVSQDSKYNTLEVLEEYNIELSYSYLEERLNFYRKKLGLNCEYISVLRHQPKIKCINQIEYKK